MKTLGLPEGQQEVREPLVLWIDLGWPSGVRQDTLALTVDQHNREIKYNELIKT